MPAKAALIANSLRLDFINPFIQSTVEVFDMMLNCTPQRTGLHVKKTSAPPYQLSAVIEATGVATGTVVLSLSRDAACEVYHRMVGFRASTIDADVRDAVGEMTNIISGNAKAKLEQLQLSIGVPKMIAGRNHSVQFPPKALPITVHFNSDVGPIAIEVGFAATEQPVAV
ncbi:MAG: chemotaxis protein CheX [Planctomycetaceae bacterium]|jgi:chemotaxis protein CheX|nr:chemotaxis protein CheX [Planctomycetaceae bacterium]MBT6483534.1 chemotaxis protein CheX [Planctomycetaceae bacterium]MBT6494882.1 chemotaxis protein CheX [Planctomycetaceae bacterium]